MPTSLEQLAQATQEAMDAVAQGRGVVKDIHRAVKEHRDAIAKQIADEVTSQVVEILADVRRDAEARIIQVIDEIREDWRRRLGLDTDS